MYFNIFYIRMNMFSWRQILTDQTEDFKLWIMAVSFDIFCKTITEKSLV